MQELLSFLGLYVGEENFNNSLWVILLILYAGAGLYMFDFYNLVKRKSRAETMGMMAIPFAVSMIGAGLAAIFVRVPAPGYLGAFYVVLKSLQLHAKLAGSAVIYFLLWGISFYLQRKRRKKEKIRWVLSCIPEYCFAVMLLFCFLWRLTSGESPFWSWPEWVLWCYLYAVYFLFCKIILLAVGLFIRLYSARIRIFKWKEGKKPSAFLFRYYVLYQNAIFRNVVLFELGILALLTVDGGWSVEMAGIMGFLYICGLFVILFSLVPIMKALEGFGAWGDAGQVKASFCREYFQEELLYRDESYTVTRHFLVDEKSPATLYYWPAVKSVGGLTTDKEGTGRTLYFGDGTECRIRQEELEKEAFLFSCADKWLENLKYADGKDGSVPQGASGQGQGAYLSLMRKLALILTFLMFMVLYTLRSS